MSIKDAKVTQREHVVKIKVGSIASVHLPIDSDEPPTPRSLAELKSSFIHDLLSIASAPTKLVAELLQGLVRIVRVVTLGGGQRKAPKEEPSCTELGEKRRDSSQGKQLSHRAEALARLESVLRKRGALMGKAEEGRVVIFLTNDRESER